MAKDCVIQLTDKLRIAQDDLQWIIQRKQGQKKDKWDGVAYCRTRAGLIACLRRINAPVTAEVEALPAWREEGLNA